MLGPGVPYHFFLFLDLLDPDPLFGDLWDFLEPDLLEVCSLPEREVAGVASRPFMDGSCFQSQELPLLQLPFFQ